VIVVVLVSRLLFTGVDLAAAGLGSRPATGTA
jgi:hypothetical protein